MYDPHRCLVTAFTLGLLPVFYFHSVLFYTDVGSTFCVLLMYCLSLHRRHLMSAVIGAVAVMFRQTNIIWVLFAIGETKGRILLKTVHHDKKELDESITKDVRFFPYLIRHLTNMLRTNTRAFGYLTLEILGEIWGYLTVVALFVTFVVWNGSIVVGAKQDHQAALNFPQLFYFAAFALAFSWMHSLSLANIRGFFKFLWKRAGFVLCFVAVAAFLIWKFTYVHRYTLADNRHYTFYVWSKIFRRHELAKYALIPGYLIAVWSLFTALQAKDVLWKASFAICVILKLVPASLLEFRYFIMPYFIYRLNMPLASYPRLAAELCLYVAVNAVTFYMFLEKPFYWENSSEKQRFVW